jgi:hypothetical protein
MRASARASVTAPSSRLAPWGRVLHFSGCRRFEHDRDRPVPGMSHTGAGRVASARLGVGRSAVSIALRSVTASIPPSDCELLVAIERHGHRALTFVWRNKGALMVTMVLETMLADPEPFPKCFLARCLPQREHARQPYARRCRRIDTRSRDDSKRMRLTCLVPCRNRLLGCPPLGRPLGRGVLLMPLFAPKAGSRGCECPPSLLCPDARCGYK